jgi:hypothetical protein
VLPVSFEVPHLYDEQGDKYVFVIAIPWEYDQLRKVSSEFFAKFQ